MLYYFLAPFWKGAGEVKKLKQAPACPLWAGQDPQLEFLFLFRSIGLQLQERMNLQIRELDLTMSQLNILASVARGGAGGVSQREIERELLLTNPTVTGILKRLEKKGFVERRVDPRDRRYKRVRLTARCRELTEQIGRQGQKTFDQFFRGFTPGELETLNQLLERLLENCGEPPQTNHRPEETE